MIGDIRCDRIDVICTNSLFTKTKREKSKIPPLYLMLLLGLGKARLKLELFRANLKTRLIDHFLKLEFELVQLVSLRPGQKNSSFI